MAWPLTPIQTYVYGTVLAPSDLNSFQSAINGVYSGTSTVKGLIVDGTGGNTPTITGGTDAPLAQFRDSANKVRAVVDHTGFPMGRVTLIRENWTGLVSTLAGPGSNTVVTGYNPLSYTGSSANQTIVPSVSLNSSPAVQLVSNADTTTGRTAAVFSSRYFAYGQADCVVLEFEIALGGGADSTGATVKVGFSSARDAALGTETSVCLAKRGSDSNWQLQTCNNSGASQFVASSATAPSAGVTQSIRIELHGSGGVYGAPRARLFVDQTLAAEQTGSSVPTSAMYFVAAMVNLTSGTTPTATIGPVSIAMSRQSYY